jgi:adenine C2-methylase RlmN of 23S rRNA A2503 and tRNA A37
MLNSVASMVISSWLLRSMALAHVRARSQSTEPSKSIKCSEWSVIEVFAEILNNAGYASPVRTLRGRYIMAACGRFKSESLKVQARDRVDMQGAAT